MAKEKISLSVLTKGIIKENPVLVLILGTCPTLAVTTLAVNGVGMGLAATFVLVCSNIAISLLKNVIPDKVRIPCYIVIIAGFVTLLSSLMEAFLPDLYSALGLFLQLIVVNCIILGRAEMFASKNGVIASALDGVGMGLGFTLALLIMGSIREILGAGTWFGIPLTVNLFSPISIFILAPGGFLVYGMVIATVNKLTKGKAIKKKEFGCEGCPNAGGCASCSGCSEKGENK
ncbi:MAG: electron transport complex subunit E [Oscillospiraceae bacterium]|nr:electron transport complex subunit E [Oscillospiraceae bacterium]